MKGLQLISEFIVMPFISQIFKLCSEKHIFPSSKFTRRLYLGTGKNKMHE